MLQQIEHTLKGLIAYGNISAYGSELKDIHRKQYERVSKQTMGQLVGQFVDNTYKEPKEQRHEERMVVESHITFNFRVESDSEYYESQKQRMADLVAERNELIHHSLPIYDSRSLGKLKAFKEKLDQQGERLKKEVDSLQTLATHMREMRTELGEFLSSEQGKMALKQSWLQGSLLVQALIRYSKESTRGDRGVNISSAGKRLRKQHPDEVEHMKARYGYGKLKALLLATNLFDIYEESTSTGGVRPLYKL